MQVAGPELLTMGSLGSSGSMHFDVQDSWELERRAPYFLRTPQRLKRYPPPPQEERPIPLRTEQACSMTPEVTV